MEIFLKTLVLVVFFSSVYCIQSLYAQSVMKYTISGYIKDKENGETLIGANIYQPETKVGATTNIYGFYSITLPEGKYKITYSYIGYEDFIAELDLSADLSFDAELVTAANIISEVVVSDKKSNENIVSNEMSLFRLDNKTIRQIPVFMGESDLIKAVQLMPGVSIASEGSSAFIVRGGSSDQNLILLDEATVYNPSHLMGFFSVFNSDAIKDVKLYKGDIPAANGGRLSSLLDVRMKDGNKKNFDASGGIGLISSRLTVEGPIVKDKASFIVSGRRTYADLFFPLFQKKDSLLSKSTLYFYDINAKINWDISAKDRIFISSYFGKDVFRFTGQDISWGNNTETFRWNHIYNPKLFSNLTLLYSDYRYELASTTGTPKFVWTSNLRDYSVKYDFTAYPNAKNTLRYGIVGTFHQFKPGLFVVTMEDTTFDFKLKESQALEYAGYLSNDQRIGGNLTINYGIRYSFFSSIGEATLNRYDSAYNFVDTVHYGKNEIYNTYSGFEPRFSLTYVLNEKSSIKAAYDRTMQYVQLASNSSGGNPLDIWFPASPNVKPQSGHQGNIGYFRNFEKPGLETSVEIFYKKMYDQVDFKDYANLLLNDRMEGELRFGDAQAYGAEFLVRRNTGNLTGWISYTLSRSERTIIGINNNNTYLSNFDRTHNLSVVATYTITPRLSVSANWVYVSGVPATLPIGRYYFGNVLIPVYSDRNEARLPAYHRLDLSITLKNKNKKERRFNSEWNFSVYNVYNRKNPYSYYFETQKDNPQVIKSYKMSLLPIVPSITYNFNF
ncbi:MAG TPA: TonB-dependent receptor [Bacteroidales bacterium]|nr:TonB-dependent receptor [Bacteroidales bacterium]